MAGLRDILVHAYYKVDTILLWDTVKNDIPKLHKALSK